MRLRLRRRGMAALLKSDEVRSDLKRRADRVAETVRNRTEGVLDHGEGGIVADTYTGRGRAGATVIGVPMEVEERDHVLGSAIDAAGD
ncbi:hypothetical protein [Salininema proteolyticum]|uniref:Uncharacterized protein n=1 Tax=Salininema proteolyticum TaxID=1607685 RepID=A0ABV8TXH6_9ACTN